MNQRRFPIVLLMLPLLFGAGCASTQGIAPLPNRTSPMTGATEAREIVPAPESRSFPAKKDVFQGAEYDPGLSKPQAGAQQLQLSLGEIVEVFRGSARLGDGQYELAFYLPEEARSVVQLVVEQKGFARTYFLRAIGPGNTVGGVVERRWLDHGGNNATDGAAEARVQAAVRAAPYLISVRS